jgi:hypothetical protein
MMSHGLVALENDLRPGIGVWEFALAREESVAVYAPRTPESFDSETGKLWRSTFVRGLGKIRVGPAAPALVRWHLTEDYGRYEVEYGDQLIDMCRTCPGTMVATDAGVTDTEAAHVLDDFERHSALDPQTAWKPTLRLISIGGRWWFFLHPQWEMCFTIFLAPEIEMINAVQSRRQGVKGYDTVEEW